MKILLLLVVALVTWFGLRGALGPSAVLVVGALGVAVLAGRKRRDWLSPRRVMRQAPAAALVALLFGWELLISNLQQLRIVFGPARLVQPHWLKFSSALESPAMRALLGMMISLTPGTMTVDIDEDGTFWVHVLVAEDDDAVVRRIHDVLERPLRRLES
ncbi:MAG: Na+/H+ antiporter subunit E [Polyangiaceae bacterium]|jgi:multisubunit Na+/H+ antiporter MnhE subunit|nr:Na+/H+ antiporter subunit E [Polyangiaceae bacterium]